MNNVLLVIHLLITLSLIGVVLVQKSEGGALGMGGSGSGGGSGGFGGFLTGQSTANLLTRTTAFLAAAFIASSLLLTILADTGRTTRSITDDITVPAIQTETEQPVAPPVSE
ncbi:preprotein translocase subunit SecG [Kiloniella spongiae]|uniref:Protein-export membrane protein SecG n=1 Tax=Kiloniella spongiae TaxID=1489064 RepID=A0A0H2MKT3_9PROT|nr:preprotein translocase subunit SecG [Kiloniella spongiae]KLN61362.1 preprotein translocase subunit SecG [Kiloniella spongiae]